MIGVRVGVKPGVFVGVSAGTLSDSIAPLPGGVIAGVSRDSTSGIYCPANATEWGLMMAAVPLVSGNPTGLWLCQETSGNLADSIGANPLVVAGTPTFRQANTGWTRLSVSITATTVQAFSLAAGPFDPSAHSVMWMWYGCLTATPGGSRTVLTVSNGATGINVFHLVSNKLQIFCGANSATTVQTYTTTTNFPMAIVYNRTASTCTLYTDKEALTVTFASAVDGNKGLGAVSGSGDPSARTSYLTALIDGAAELTTTNVRNLYSKLGWSPLF